MKNNNNIKDARLRDARRETERQCPVSRVPQSRVKQFMGFVTLLFLLTSCQTEMKLAKNFIAEQAQTRVAVYFPEQAEVKVEYNTQYSQKTEVLNGFSQDLFLDVMYNAYAEMLRSYNLDVYVPEDSDNVQVDSVHWLVMLSRMYCESTCELR